MSAFITCSLSIHVRVFNSRTNRSADMTAGARSILFSASSAHVNRDVPGIDIRCPTASALLPLAKSA